MIMLENSCSLFADAPAARDAIQALMARGFHEPGDVENRLGFYVGNVAREAGASGAFPTPSKANEAQEAVHSTGR